MWEADHPTIPYFVENFPMEDKPEGTFARFMVDPNEVYHRAGGSDDPLIGRSGRVIIQICVPADTGTQLVWNLADYAHSVFHMWRTDDGALRCSDTEITRRDPVSADPYYIVKLSTAYTSLKRG
jgi:hypothetical protein